MKKIIIIGGGIAGLSAGVYARQQGFETIIFEKHTISGGLCTGWNRQGYHIDGCIHWMTGTSKDSPLRALWENVGALSPEHEVFQKDYFDVYEACGEKIYLWRDIEKLKNDLIKLSPQDTKAICKFVKDLKSVHTMRVPTESPVNMMTLPQLFRQLWSMRGMLSVLLRLNGTSCQEYAKRFKHPAIQRVFRTCMPEGYSVAAFIFTLGTFTRGNGGIPSGGSFQMTKRMTDRYLSLGGVLKTGTLVNEIKTSLFHATGIEYITMKGEKAFESADYVISACDVHTTFNTLLKDCFFDKQFMLRFRQPKVYATQSCVLATYAVDADLSDYPYSIVLESEKYRAGVTDYDDVSIRNYVYEPTFAPKGQTVISVLVSQSDDDYAFWKAIYFDKSIYHSEKERLAAFFQTTIEKRYPELVGKIKLLDVLTPMTFIRYCGSYHGAWMAFRMGRGTKNLMHTGKIKGLRNCYLTGQWLQPPGGLPIAMTMGKFTVQRICKKEGMPFRF